MNSLLKEIKCKIFHCCLDNSSSCIDLLFTSPSNLIVKSGAHGSLHSNGLHKIIYIYLSNFSLCFIFIHIVTPVRECYDKDVKTSLIGCAVTNYNWKRAFLSTDW